MTSIRVFFSRILDLLLRRHREERLSEELQAHLDLLTDEYVASGMSEDEARLAARRAFGGVLQVKMNYRDQRGLPSVDGVLQDLRFAARLLAKDRRFTLTAVVALGLGIGVTNTVFTLVNTALIRDVPFEQPDQLIGIRTRTGTGQEQGGSYPEYRAWRDASTMVEGLAASTLAAMNLSDETRAPDRLRGTYISANAFRLLRVAPMLGRDFLPEDDRPDAPAVVIVSYGVWQDRYGGEASAVGKVVRINNVPSTLIGVMPAGFRFPAIQDLWQPLSLMPGIAEARRDARRLSVFARLHDAADLPRVAAAIDTIAAQFARDYADTNQQTSARVIRLRDMRPESTAIFMTLMGAVGFVLLVACANVANLLLARSLTRAREIAIRASLGATRWRIVRQLLIECVLVATMAGALGLLLSVYGVRLLGVAFDVIDVSAPAQINTPYWVNLSMNAPVFLFVAALCLITGLGFGLVPALHISKTDVNDTLKDGGRGGVGGRRTQRWTGVFVTAELALTLVLLTGAGLLWRSFLTVYLADPIVDASDLVTMRVGLPAQKYPTTELVQRFHALLDERLASKSDLLRATIANDIPYPWTRGLSRRQLAIDQHAPIDGATLPTVSYAFAGPRYFEILGVPLLRGRVFTARDEGQGQEGAIVDQRLASMFFPDTDPLGRRIQIVTPGTPVQTSPWLTIVGLVPTFGQSGDGRPAEPVVYVPLRLDPAPRTVALIVRRSVGAERAAVARGAHIGDDPQLAAIIAAVRDEVASLDPDLPVYSVETQDAALARSRWPARLIGTWFAILAGIALVVASVGLYALTAQSVAIRTQEIGVRMALGARASEVVWLFLRRTLVQLGIGLAFGIAGALGVGRLLQALHPGTEPSDPLTLLVVATLLIVVAAGACALPARRAALVDPATALRTE